MQVSVPWRGAHSASRFAFGRALGASFLALAVLATPAGAAFETSARQAMLVDLETGSVLLDKSADERMPTSSMAKIMTIYLLFEALQDGRLSLDDTLPVSEYAWRKGGSKMFVEVGTEVAVEDLIRGIVVQSGNDASIVVAEALAGTEEAFARRMTDTARSFGMDNTSFTNSTGWPDPDHYSTARDLALLSERLIRDFPQYYHYFSELEFTFSGIKQGTRNPLLYRDIGADGLKTGHTEDAGYGLAASAAQDGRRLLLVVNGLDSVNARAEESARLLSWGFREFENVTLFQAEDTIETADVWMGVAETVPLVLADDLSMTLKRGSRRNLQVTVRVDGPVEAPIAKGDRIGTLVVAGPEMAPRELPLLAGAAVEEKGFFGRAATNAGQLLFGWLD